MSEAIFDGAQCGWVIRLDDGKLLMRDKDHPLVFDNRAKSEAKMQAVAALDHIVIGASPDAAD